MEKFERLNEAVPEKETLDKIIIFILLLVIAIISGAWYYQNYIFQEPDYAKENEIKKLEEEKKLLESEINRILEENSRLKDTLKTTAKI